MRGLAQNVYLLGLVMACSESKPQDPIDSGVPAIPYQDLGVMADEDAAVSPDAGIWPDAESAEAGFKDATTAIDSGLHQDAALTDSGPSAEARCRATFSQVGPFQNVNALLPSERRHVYRSWLSGDLLSLYLTVEMPHDLNSALFSDDIFVLSRSSTTGAFQQIIRSNLDTANTSGNESHERDLTYVSGINRFWYVEATVEPRESHEQLSLISVRLTDPAHPEAFDNFLTENLNLSEANQGDSIRSPALTPDGLVMVAAKRSPIDRSYSLYQYRRNSLTESFDEGQLLTVSSTGATDLEPWLSDDGLQLLYRSGGEGGNDIYCAWRNTISEPFTDRQVFGRNSVSSLLTHEYAPFLRDGHLYFIRQEPAGLGQLYRASP
jgi:hypothetical protein